MVLANLAFEGVEEHLLRGVFPCFTVHFGDAGTDSISGQMFELIGMGKLICRWHLVCRNELSVVGG